MRNILLLLTIFIFAISAFNSCNKLNCTNTVYSFKIGTKAYPDRDSVHIGDTIWIEINSPTSLTDIASNKTTDYRGASNLGTAISFDIFTGGSISDPGTAYAAADFNYYLSIGNPINNSFVDRIREYSFLESNNMFRFKLAVIPKMKGIYGIGISNAVNVYRQSDKCSKANFEIDFENTNQHLYLYQNNRPGYVINDYEQKHVYCFKVY